MNHLFAYGTLMCQDIMREVAGCSRAHAPGTLHGFRRKSVRGEAYPGIRPDATGKVDGVVYFDVPDWAWQRLDRFEGPMYRRRLLEVELGEAVVAAGAYVVRTEFPHRLEERDWDLSEFLSKGKAIFKRSYQGYRSL